MKESTSIWKDQWIKKRSECIKQVFTFQHLFNFHLENKNVRVLSRDREMSRLQNSKNDTYESQTGADSVVSCKFCPQLTSSNIVASADENGKICLLDTNQCFNNPKNVIPAHNNALFDIVWHPNEFKLMSVSGDKKACLWDLERIILLSSFSGHEHSVKTAVFMPNQPDIFATGGRDGKICIWDSRVIGKCGISINPDKIVNHAAGELAVNKKTIANSVTGLAFQDSNLLWCTGSSDKFIRMYDLRRACLSWKPGVARTKIRGLCNGFTDLKLSPDCTKLYASGLKSDIFAYNINSCDENPVGKFSGHHANSYYIRLCVSADGEYLASGSTSEIACVWKTAGVQYLNSSRKPFIKLAAHTGEVACVDIHQNYDTRIVTCGDDSTVRLWRSTSILESDEPNLHSLNVHKAQVFVDTDEDVYFENHSAPQTTNEDNKMTFPVKDNVTIIAESSSMASAQQTPPRKAVRTSELSSCGKRKIHETSPTRENRKRFVLSPTKVQDENAEYRSPTMNLPNYVLEGTGPSHSCPRLRQKENTDWLTEISRQKSTSKNPASADKPPRRTSQTGRKTSRRTLLEYYKKSSKSSEDLTQKRSTERIVSC